MSDEPPATGGSVDGTPDLPPAGGNMIAPDDGGFAEEILETELDPGTLDMLENLVSQEWVKGNLSEAEAHEQKWLARTIIMEIKAMHPSHQSIWQGEVRAYASGDPGDKLEALNEAQETALYQLVLAHLVRLTRSRDMEQQSMLRTIIQRREQKDLTEGENEGWI